MALMSGWSLAVLGCGALLVAGCATGKVAEPVPLPADAQRAWTAYWTAVARGDVAEWNRITHSSARKADATEFDPRVQADARSFLTLCYVQSGSMAMGGDRASYRTRCADGPTRSGLFPWAGAEIVLRKDVDGAWRFFCFGCGLPYHPQSEESALSPYDAQRLWVAFWSAVERGDPVEVRELLHSSLPGEAVAEMARPGMAGEARTYLYQCSAQFAPPAATENRARYPTRCLAGDGPEMTLVRDSDQVWRILCVGSCRR
jgi:hypothetical protein